MSLILEALRKSEAERRRAQAPDLFAEPQLALPRSHPTWPRWAWFALAGVAVVALLLLLRELRPQPTPVATTRVPSMVSQPLPAETSDTAASMPVTTVATPPPQSGLPAKTMPAPAPSPPLAPNPAPAVVAATPAFEQPRMPPEPIAVAQAPAPDPVPAPAPVQATASGTGGAMSLSELGAEERQRLPTLKLSMHMWNDAPGQRFVILDGQRLGEGDRIGEAVVEQITRDGAILDWNGRRLRVSMR